MTDMRTRPHRLIIVGAGPAGLAAGVAASALKPLVVEAGFSISERCQGGPQALISGVGGAGLYSDGKFSFWPAASNLWQLDPVYLSPAYEWLRDLLAMVGVSAPARPESIFYPGERSDLKSYQSVYVSPEDRMRIISELVSVLPEIAVGRTVDKWSFEAGIWSLYMSDGEILKAERLIIATGRFGPLLLAAQLPNSCIRVGRLEVGIRIEQPHMLTMMLAIHAISGVPRV